ncbi:MAG: beta-lactamase family protein [Clostridia bacterium]|nr:beta-lactamase family protein [Clostridia bacterium]
MNRNQLEYLTKTIEKEIEMGRLKDMSVRVLKQNEMIYDQCFGDYKEDTIFRIYSMTKPVTATAIMILHERGLLDLRDPISKYLPAFAKQRVLTDTSGLVPVKTPMTIQHCLNMTSGLVYPSLEHGAGRYLNDISNEIEEREAKGDPVNTIELCNMIALAPLMFQPGTRWFYSVSADVLSGVVEVVAGMNYGDFLKKEIFEPLGMNETSYYAGLGERINRLATVYQRRADGILEKASEKRLRGLGAFTCAYATTYEGGGAGLCSTMNDYTKFAQMLLHNGTLNGVRILGRKTVEFMKTNQLTDAVKKDLWFESTDGYTYSNLLRIFENKGAAGFSGSIGEFGWDGMMGTFFCVDQTEQLVALYFQQIVEGADLGLRRRMNQIIYGAVE